MTIELVIGLVTVTLAVGGALGATIHRAYLVGRWAREVEDVRSDLGLVQEDVTALKVSVEALKLRGAEDGVLLRTVVDGLASLTNKVDRLIERMGERP